VLRTADVGLDGKLRVTAGATLVRDSDPRSEAAETHAKAAGILSAFGLVPSSTSPAADVTTLVEDPGIQVALSRRNDRLSRFWLTDQSEAAPAADLAGRRVVVLDGEDDFVAMLRHLLHVLGMTTTAVSHRDYRDGDFDGADLVIVGPGPGDPRDLSDSKIATVRGAVDTLLQTGQRFLAVCLGHQVLCGALGFDLTYKDIVFQGTQTPVHILGRRENVGFYNTFVARAPSSEPLPAGLAVDADPVTGDVHLVRGPHFVGVQFHAESILTENGFDLVHEIVRSLLLPQP
jgi:phenazine biosynthesis protein phzE